MASTSSSVGLPASASTDYLVSPWLMRSPPLPSTSKQIAPNFLTFRCSQPALRATEPMQVWGALLCWTWLLAWQYGGV